MGEKRCKKRSEKEGINQKQIHIAWKKMKKLDQIPARVGTWDLHIWKAFYSQNISSSCDQPITKLSTLKRTVLVIIPTKSSLLFWKRYFFLNWYFHLFLQYMYVKKCWGGNAQKLFILALEKCIRMSLSRL